MNSTQRDAARLADVYAHISANPATTIVKIKAALGQLCAAEWAVEQLMSKGMIVRLANVAGVHCVDGRYATVRAARSM